MATFPFDDPRDNPGYLLWQVSMRWQRLMTQALSAISLTQTQFVMLAALAWLTEERERLAPKTNAAQAAPAAVTKSDVARHANVDRMMASKLLRVLGERGLVDQRPHPTERRAQAVSLTARGREVLAEALQIVGRVDGEFFGARAAASVEVLGGLMGE